jgi:cytosine/adenosine deaminase-related metal-dependent hydrolase
VHLNYLTGADLDLLAAHRHEITAVFCPRSHEFFGHAPHPLQDLLRRGIRVALGTDGRSSNDALCMFREMSRVREIAPDLSAPAILGLATTSGAIALGLGGDAGSLETSRYADLTARTLPLPVQEASDDRILEALVSGETEPRLTMVGGQVVSETVGRPGRSRSRKESR